MRQAHADAGLDLYDEVRHAKHRFLYLGHDPAVCALSIKSVLQWALGHPTQGVQSERDAIDLARRLQHVPSLAHALWFVCQAQVARGDAAAVAKTAEELLTLSEEHGLPLTHGTALACLGWATAHTDDVSRGIRCLKEGLAMYNRLGLRTNLCIMICLLAETYFMAGEYERGIQQVNLAIDTSSEIGDRWCLPRIHTIRAQLLQAFWRNRCGGSKPAKGCRYCRSTICQRVRSCRRQTHLHASGATRARCSKRANCSLRFTAGSRRVSTRAI